MIYLQKCKNYFNLVVSIPKKVAEALHLKKGDCVAFVDDSVDCASLQVIR